MLHDQLQPQLMPKHNAPTTHLLQLRKVAPNDEGVANSSGRCSIRQ